MSIDDFALNEKGIGLNTYELGFCIGVEMEWQFGDGGKGVDECFISKREVLLLPPLSRLGILSTREINPRFTTQPNPTQSFLPTD